MKTGIDYIQEERVRQQQEEGWTEEHDAEYTNEELARVAAVYAIPESHRMFGNHYVDTWLWPPDWDTKWFKPTPNDRVKELAKAGALIAAAIDRELNNLV